MHTSSAILFVMCVLPLLLKRGVEQHGRVADVRRNISPRTAIHEVMLCELGNFDV